MKIRTGLAIVFIILVLLGNSTVTLCSSTKNLPVSVRAAIQKNAPVKNKAAVPASTPVSVTPVSVTPVSVTPVSVITAVPERVPDQQILLAEIVKEKGTDVKIINAPVFVLDEEGCIYEPSDKSVPFEIRKDIEITADNVTLADTVINGDLYIYADNIILKSLAVKGTLFISQGKALKLFQVTSENIEVIVKEEPELVQTQDAPASADTTIVPAAPVGLSATSAADASISLTAPSAPAHEETYEPVKADGLPAIDGPVAAQPRDLSQAPEMPKVLETPEKQVSGTPVKPKVTQAPELPKSTQSPEIPKTTQIPEKQKATQIPEKPKATQIPEKPKAIKAYLKLASISDASSHIVIVNKERSIPASWKPNDLVKLQVPYKGRTEARYLRKEAADALTKLFAKAKGEGIELYAISGYRSYNLQTTVFAKYTDMLGILLAQRVSARPGQSEHQTGLAIDISSKSMNYALSKSFEKTREGKWLASNAAAFGFVLRYPKGKESITGYDYEPWHFRYVGRGIAADVMDKGLTLEEYFSLFNAELS